VNDLTTYSLKPVEMLCNEKIAKITNSINNGEIEQAVSILKSIKREELTKGDSIRVADIFNNLSLEFSAKGMFEDSLWARNKCLEIICDFDNQLAIANSLEHLAEIELNLNKLDEAKKHLREAEKICTNLGDELGLSRIVIRLGRIETIKGNFENAKKLFLKGLKISKKLKNQEVMASSIYQLGAIEERYGNYNKAKSNYLRTLELSRNIGDLPSIAVSLHQIGVIDQQQCKYNEAKKLYDESYQIKRKLNDYPGMASSLHQLGIIEQHQGNYAKAKKLYQESLQIKRGLNDQRGIANSLHQLGRIEQELKNYHEARELYQESLRVRSKMHDPLGYETTLNQLAKMKKEEENYNESRKLPQKIQETKKSSDQTVYGENMVEPQCTSSGLMSQIDLSFVIPAYNEEEYIEQALGNLNEGLKDKTLSYEVIVVDDGSRDRTYQKAMEYAKTNGHIKVISYSRNRGLEYATKMGFSKSVGDIIVFADSDTDIDSNTISGYTEALKHGDIVVSSPRHPSNNIKTSLLNSLLFYGFSKLVPLLTGIPFYYPQTVLRAMKKSAFSNIFPRLSMKRNAFTIELLTVANLYGLKVVVVPMNINIHIPFNLKSICQTFLDLLGIAYRLRVIHWYRTSIKPSFS
jgi:tetratricopeptide (TPR) repeat protein